MTLLCVKPWLKGRGRKWFCFIHFCIHHFHQTAPWQLLLRQHYMQNCFLVAHWSYKIFNILEQQGFKTKTKSFFNKTFDIRACHQLFSHCPSYPVGFPGLNPSRFRLRERQRTSNECYYLSLLQMVIMRPYFHGWLLTVPCSMVTGGTGPLPSTTPSIHNPVIYPISLPLREGFQSNGRAHSVAILLFS